MNTEKQTTRKQHYVPQFYLKQWVDSEQGFYPLKIERKVPPKLIVFDKKSDPSRFCYENFFYAQHTGKEDESSQFIEKGFAEIEAIFSKLLPKLESKILKYEQITEEEKYHLSEFMIFIWLRGKQYREQSQKMSEYMMKEINKHTVQYCDKNPKIKAEMERLGLSKKDMIDFAEKGEYGIDFGNMHHMSIMKDMYGFCNILSAKFWRVYISTKGEFITSDVPYVDTPTSKEFWGNDFLSREQKFILSPNIVIVATCPKDDVGKKFVRKDITNNKSLTHNINSNSLMHSIRFGFHKDKKLLEELKGNLSLQYKLGSQKIYK